MAGKTGRRRRGRLVVETRVAGGADPLIYRGTVGFVTGELPWFGREFCGRSVPCLNGRSAVILYRREIRSDLQSGHATGPGAAGMTVGHIIGGVLSQETWTIKSRSYLPPVFDWAIRLTAIAGGSEAKERLRDCRQFRHRAIGCSALMTGACSQFPRARVPLRSG